MFMAEKKRETSKVLLWTIVTASLAISVVSMVLCAWLAVDQLGMAITVIGGLWSGAVIAAIGFYSDKAKAENEIKLSHNAELEALRAEGDALRAEAEALRAEFTPKPKASKKSQKPDYAAMGARIAAMLEQAAGSDEGQQSFLT